MCCRLALAVFLLALVSPLGAQDVSVYPRVNTADSYVVDPHWPQKPANVEWGHVPGVAVDAEDRVWMFTRANPPVQVYQARDGKFIRAWGEKDVKKAHHLKIDGQGNIWLADIGKHVVMQFTPGGQLVKTLGTPDQPGEDETHFNMPTDMVVTPAGDVFIADGYGNNRVVHYDKQGKFVKAWGKLGQRPGEFSLPHAIAVDSQGKLYVADRNNVRVQVFDQSGKFLDQWTHTLIPWGFWITKEDHIWVCGSSPMVWEQAGEKEPLGCPPKDQLFMRFTTAGKATALWTIPKGEDGKEKPGDLNWLHALALDSQGNIYAGDIKGQRLQKFVRRPGKP